MPFFSPTSLTGMALGGAQATLFAMGVFNPSGTPLMPVLRVCGNPRTLEHWSDALDLDVSGLISGEMDLDAAADGIARALGDVSRGVLTASERWGEGQLILPRVLAAL